MPLPRVMSLPLMSILSTTARPIPSGSPATGLSVPSSKTMSMLLILAPTGIDPGRLVVTLKHSEPQAVSTDRVLVHSAGSCGALLLGAAEQPTKKKPISVSILNRGAPAPQWPPLR